MRLKMSLKRWCAIGAVLGMKSNSTRTVLVIVLLFLLSSAFGPISKADTLQDCLATLPTALATCQNEFPTSSCQISSCSSFYSNVPFCQQVTANIITIPGVTYGVACDGTLTEALPSPAGYPCACSAAAEANLSTGGTSNSSSNAGGCGSIIHIDSQAVGESVPVIGTPFSLVYFSDRVSGNAGNYTIQVPLTSSTVPSGTTSIDVTLTIGSRVLSQTWSSPTANMSTSFVWDGNDSSGNPVYSPQVGQISITYNGYISYPFTQSVTVGSLVAQQFGLGGWGLSALHFYDSNTQTLYYGDGTSRSVTASLYNSGTQYIAGNDDGSELYVFDLTGKHLYTLNGLTGSTVYTFAYDSSNRLSTVTDAYSNVTTVVRNGSGVLTGIQSPYGQTTSFTLDSNGYLATITNPNSETTTMTYVDAGGLLNTFQKPRGQTSTMTYSTGLLSEDSSSAGNSTTLTDGTDPSTGYPSITSTSAVGITTQYVINNSTPYVRIQKDPDSTQSTYNLTPNSSSSFTGYGFTNSTSYEADARLGSIANVPSASTVSTTDSSWVQNVTQNMGSWTQTGTSSSPLFFNYTTIDTQKTVNSNLWDYLYTLSSGETVVTSPKSRKTYYWQDTYGKPTEFQLATYSPVNLSYDTRGRLNGITQSSRSSSIAYNSSGFVSSVTDALSEVTSFTYDGAGHVLTQTLPDTRVITYTYDSNGNLTSVTPASSNEHSFTYNNFDESSEYLPPALTGLSVNTTYTYSNDKKLTLITRPDGNTATFTYDGTTGYLTSIVIPSGTYTYTSSQQKITSTTSADGVEDDLTYSGNQVTQDEVSNSVAILGYMQFAYNNDFNINSSTVVPNSGSSSWINYSFDTDTLMTAAGSESITRSSTTGQVTATLLTKIRDFTTYDSTYGELATYTAQYSPSPSPSPIMSEGFTRDALGRISAESVSLNGATAIPYGYTYDSAGRLTAVSKNGSSYSSYTYDSNSNRTSGNVGGTSFTSTYDAEDRLLTYNTKTYTYTTNGDRSTVVDSSLPSGHQTTTYTFDELGNLKQVVTPTTTVNYKLDGFNRRVQKINGTTVKATYLYRNQVSIEAVLNANGTLNERFVYGAKPNVPDYLVKSGTTYRIISDERGSVRFVINASTGAISQHIEYDEFGNVLTDTSPGFQPFAFAGCLYDNDTKLCHFGAREYDPSTGRFLSKDPLLFAGGDSNLYGYVLNDPINGIDPYGLWSITISGYFGPGGGITFGKNPGGGLFTTFSGGWGLGGGISYNPNGTSPGWNANSPTSSPSITLGGYGSISGSLGPLTGGYGVTGGANFTPGAPISGYSSAGGNYGANAGWGISGGVCAGGEVGFH